MHLHLVSPPTPIRNRARGPSWPAVIRELVAELAPWGALVLVLGTTAWLGPIVLSQYSLVVVPVVCAIVFVGFCLHRADRECEV